MAKAPALLIYVPKQDFVLPRLPIHPKINPDESWVGYLMRLDEVNEYRGKLFRKYPAKDVQGLLSVWHEGISSCFSKEIHSLGSHHLGTKIRFCPYCMQELGYLKVEWQLSYSVVCTIHEVELLDYCQGCHEPRERNSGLSSHITCRFSFLTSTPNRCSKDLVLLHRFVIGDNAATEPLGILGEGFANISLQDRLQIIDAFTWVAMAKRKELEDLNSDTLQYSVYWMRNMLRPVAAAFATETGFKHFLDFLNITGVSHCSFDKEYFQHFYNQLLNRIQHPCFARMKRVLETYINDNWQHPLNRRNKNLSREAITLHPWLSLVDACRIMDLSRSAVLYAIKTNMVGYQTVRSEGRVTYIVYRPDLLNRRNEIAERVTAVEAAVILGVTKKQFLKFRQMGLFKRVTPPQKGICSHWSFSRSELEQFISELCDCPETTSFDGQISLSKAMRLYWRKLDAGVADMAVLIKGQLLAAKRCPTQTGLRQLMVDKENLCQLLEGKNLQDVLTISALGKELKINEEFAYQLVNLGLIECQTDQSRHTRVIAHQQLDDFKQHFVLLSKLSKCLGLNSRDLMNYFAGKGVYPVGHDRPRQLRQKVYIREHIWHLSLVMNCVKNHRDWLV